MPSSAVCTEREGRGGGDVLVFEPTERIACQEKQDFLIPGAPVEVPSPPAKCQGKVSGPAMQRAVHHNFKGRLPTFTCPNGAVSTHPLTFSPHSPGEFCPILLQTSWLFNPGMLRTICWQDGTSHFERCSYSYLNQSQQPVCRQE